MEKILENHFNLFLMDETTDLFVSGWIEALIDALEDFSGSVIIVTHTELILRRLQLDQIIVCEEAHQKCFLGDYDLFLDQIGWEEEKKPSNNQKPRDTRPAKQTSNRSLEKQIEACENQITTLEAKQLECQHALEQGKPSADLLKTLGQIQKEIDALYKQLEALYEKKQ